MKKYSKVLSVLVMTMMLVLVFTACGKDESKVSGKTYTLASYTVNGEDATATLTAMFSEQSFIFKEKDVCVQRVVWAGEMAEVMGKEPIEQTGTYEEKGNTVKVTFKVEGEEDTVVEFTIDADTIKLVEEGSTTVYKLKANA